jgi:hypothetical protein
MSGGRGSYDAGGLRGVPGACPGAEPKARADRRGGRPLGPQGRYKVREIIEDAGREVVYLPAYSPDLNPIEEAFAKLKTLLRKAGGAPAKPCWKRWVRPSMR